MKFLVAIFCALPLSLLALPIAIPGNSFNPGVTASVIGQTILSGTVTSANVTNGDAIYWQTNLASGGTLPIYRLSPAPLSFDNLAPTVATFDGSTLTALQNGTVRLLLEYGYGESLLGYEFRLPVNSATSAGTNYVFQTNVAASLSHHVSTNLFARLTGTAATRRALFTTRTTGSTNYVRNTNFFLSDTPGIEAYPAGNNSVPAMNGCLISPRHILSVAHIGSQVGQVLFFVNRTNDAVLARTVLEAERVTISGDMTVAVLDSPLPGSIVPAAVLTNYSQKLPQYTNATAAANFLRRLPVVMFNQDISPALQTLANIGSGVMSTTESAATYGAAWTQAVRAGDSGSPCLVPIGGRMVIVGNWTTYNAGGAVWMLTAEIQAAMNTLTARRGFTNETLAAVATASFTSF